MHQITFQMIYKIIQIPVFAMVSDWKRMMYSKSLFGDRYCCSRSRS